MKPSRRGFLKTLAIVPAGAMVPATTPELQRSPRPAHDPTLTIGLSHTRRLVCGTYVHQDAGVILQNLLRQHDPSATYVIPDRIAYIDKVDFPFVPIEQAVT